MKDPSNLFGAIWVLALLFGSLSLTPPLLQAQSSDGTLVGTVTDQSDAAIPNATAKVISSQYGFSREEGRYFRNTVWYWSPLWVYVYKVCPDVLTARDMIRGAYNSNHKISARKATAIGKRLRAPYLRLG